MPDDIDVEELELSDSELMKLLKSHGLNRRTLMKAVGAGAGVSALAGMSGTAAANRGRGQPSSIDPIWGYSAIEEDYESPGDFPEKDDFPPQIRPDHEIDLHIHLNPAEGEFEGFHFAPAGLLVNPGDIVMFRLPTPDHTVSAFHSGFGRQTRVPDSYGPFSSPLLPVGGYWLYRFGEEGVHDFLCAPHELLGMVGRIVAYDGEGEVPSDEFDNPNDLRPPEDLNLLNYFDEILGTPPLPYFPSPAETFESTALSADNIVDEGTVPWHHVLDEYRS